MKTLIGLLAAALLLTLLAFAHTLTRIAPALPAETHYHTFGNWEQPTRTFNARDDGLSYVQFRYCPVCGAADSRSVHVAVEKP